jgi:chromate transporter
MGRSLAPDRTRASLAILAAMIVLASRTALTQVLVIAAAAVAGRLLLPLGPMTETSQRRVAVGRGVAIGALAVFIVLLVALPLARRLTASHALAVFDSFYRAGSLVFGGGHVVLPLLQAEVVPPGWVTNEAFIAGYGAAQAVPGPLFTFSAYLGAVMHEPPTGWLGGAWALVAVFLPSYLLIVGALPFWEQVRAHPGFQAALRGVNAAVVGLLLAALYDPVWTSAIRGHADFALALLVLGLLMFWRWPSWLVVIAAAAGGVVLG